jgi:D-alanyl-D-alanine dipeptidase
MKIKTSLLCCALAFSFSVGAKSLPKGFVYLNAVDPTIIQELRYAGYHNFLGRPVKGYEHAKGCILTQEAAQGLKAVQTELRKNQLSLKVYDCYRPQRAVNDFMAWSRQPKDQPMKAEFYPRVNKADVFKLGYVAEKSGHSRGSTMDLTLVPLKPAKQEAYQRGQKLFACYSPSYQRFQDNSLNMGSGYDCLDEVAHVDYEAISPVAHANRLILNGVMVKYGFKPYAKEWWHFTLEKEPYPQTYFDFPVA